MTRTEIEDFAKMHTPLHRAHVRLVNNGASHAEWTLHVVNYVLPSYRRREHEPYEGATITALENAAKHLRDYFNRVLP